MTRIGLISDTHGFLHPRAMELLRGCHAILHAGDVCDDTILDQLETLAPTFAVGGNCDWGGARLPELRLVELPFGKAILLHGHLAPCDLAPAELVRHYKPLHAGLRLIVFGHTHRQVSGRHEGVLVVNPGSAGKPRFRDRQTVALLEHRDKEDRLEVEWFDLATGHEMVPERRGA